MRGKRNVHRDLVGKPEEKTPLGRLDVYGGKYYNGSLKNEIGRYVLDSSGS
jgi:hypothetical protein